MLTSDRGLAMFESLGYYIVPNHFYSPIHDYAALRRNDRVFERDFSLRAVDLNEAAQPALLSDLCASFARELDFPVEPTGEPTAYHIRNDQFGFTSAAILHCMMRRFKPRRVIEVGAGYSTLVTARAARLNRRESVETSIVAIEPYPRPFLQQVPELTRLVRQKVEDVDLEEFDSLGENDVLFIDSSHVVRTAGDVNFLDLEVLPRLKPGVVVHIHDIFLPREYPKQWVAGMRRFWTEQYLLHAFLLFNDAFKVLWCGNLMYERHLPALRTHLPRLPGFTERDNYFSSSFWMQRTPRPGEG
jgi:predicted O-methyltransferase YrrM